MRLRKFAVRVHDPEHQLFGVDWTCIQRFDARSVIAEIFPNGPSARVVGGFYAEVCCASERLRWRFYAGRGEPSVSEIRMRWG